MVDVKMDEDPSGLVMEDDHPLAALAERLRMAEAEVYRRMLDLVERLRPWNEAPPENVTP